jgi:cobalamin biosynthetic protein CobC
MATPPHLFDPFALPSHGGDLSAATARFGRPAKGWVDLSTGINPYSYPVPPFEDAVWRCLPDASQDLALREAAAASYGVRDVGQIVAAPGSQSVIQVLPRLRPCSRVAVVGPTYGEHLDSWGNAGHQILPCESLERVGDAEVVVVTNPNNPDGQRHDPDRLVNLARGLNRKGGLLVVDEAFADATPELSLAGDVGPGLLVLRSFGKFFGLAGLRLGFAVTEPGLARRLRAELGPWAVSGPAIAIGCAALSDAAWIEAMRSRLVSEAADFTSTLTRLGLSVVGGTPLFLLVNAPRAWALYEYLGQHGVLARPFAASPRWLRFGLPAAGEIRRHLIDVLEGWAG